MFNSELVVAIKVNGNIVREENGMVAIPFGSEYSIFLKNLSYRKAVVYVGIDGSDVLSGKGIIVEAKSDIILERSIVSGDLVSGRKFKFIEKTDQISAFRGDRADDGIITIDYVFESLSSYMTKNNAFQLSSLNMQGPSSYDGPNYRGMIDSTFGNVQTNYNVNSLSSDVSKSGITTEGSKSNQEFSVGQIDKLSTTRHSMSIRLVGKANNIRVETIVSTKTKTVCAVCGKKNKQSHEYCSRCGSYLRS